MAGWNDGNETVVGGTGQLYVAPVGTALPASESASLNAAFEGLGYTSEDGVSINKALDVIRLGAWQTTKDVRRIRDNEAFRITANLLQWNESNVPLVFGGGTISEPTTGHYKYTPPAVTDAVVEKALILDVQDGTEIIRFVVPRGSVTDAVDSQFSRGQFSGLPLAFEDMEPNDGSAGWYFFTNIADFAAGS